jgi:hypothetical protein
MCTSLMTGDVEHLFICLLETHMSLVKHLFKSFFAGFFFFFFGGTGI